MRIKLYKGSTTTEYFIKKIKTRWTNSPENFLEKGMVNHNVFFTETQEASSKISLAIHVVTSTKLNKGLWDGSVISFSNSKYSKEASQIVPVTTRLFNKKSEIDKYKLNNYELESPKVLHMTTSNNNFLNDTETYDVVDSFHPLVKDAILFHVEHKTDFLLNNPDFSLIKVANLLNLQKFEEAKKLIENRLTEISGFNFSGNSLLESVVQKEDLTALKIKISSEISKLKANSSDNILIITNPQEPTNSESQNNTITTSTPSNFKNNSISSTSEIKSIEKQKKAAEQLEKTMINRAKLNEEIKSLGLDIKKKTLKKAVENNTTNSSLADAFKENKKEKGIVQKTDMKKNPPNNPDE